MGFDYHVRVRHLLTWIDFHRFLSRMEGLSIYDNADKNTVKQELDPRIVARFLRIYQQDYHWFGSLSLELYGCTSGQWTHLTLKQNSFCVDLFVLYRTVDTNCWLNSINCSSLAASWLVPHTGHTNSSGIELLDAMISYYLSGLRDKHIVSPRINSIIIKSFDSHV